MSLDSQAFPSTDVLSQEAAYMNIYMPVSVELRMACTCRMHMSNAHIAAFLSSGETRLAALQRWPDTYYDMRTGLFVVICTASVFLFGYLIPGTTVWVAPGGALGRLLRRRLFLRRHLFFRNKR